MFYRQKKSYHKYGLITNTASAMLSTESSMLSYSVRYREINITSTGISTTEKKRAQAPLLDLPMRNESAVS